MNSTEIIAWLYWNPHRVAFTIPYFNLPIAWYGILFAGGFVAGYFILLPIVRKYLQQQQPQLPLETINTLTISFVDHITWFIVIGTVVGARLGHVLFYDWPYYAAHPIEILMIRNGGLASHGGTLGIMLALPLFLYLNRKKFPEFTFIKLLDVLVIPTAFVAFCIRMGNFVNQEILGTTTSLPWAIIFGDPADGTPVVPRHPVQLYEAIAYIITFFILGCLWRRNSNKLISAPGMLSGLFFILIFGSRFLIEFIKMHQTTVIDESFLQVGQFLSIPFILFGLALVVFSIKNNKNCVKNS